MSKITRKSYRRKKIIMGASLFGAIGLVSTGFAAWVLSAPAVSDPQAMGLMVGEVSDKNMKFEDIIIYETGDSNKTALNPANFHFEPLASDTTGRVRYDGVTGESLSLTVEGKLLHSQNLGEMTASIELTSGLKADFDSAISKGYIVAPEAYKATAATNPITLWSASQQATSSLFESENSGTGDLTMTFSYEVKFEWGAFFQGMNPSVFFDTTAAGLAIEQGTGLDPTTANTVGGILNDLHSLLDQCIISLTLTADPS